MIILTIIFDQILAYSAFNFASHMVTSNLLFELFNVVTDPDKVPGQLLFEGMLYFGAAVIIELTVVSHIEPLRCLAFAPSYYRNKEKRAKLNAGARTKEVLIIAAGFVGFGVLNMLVGMYI